jgi:Ser/Thr protein kinase RdoA (MazF antagonist)
MEPIPDKARISLDFPDKTYIGSFGRDAKFEVAIDADSFLLKFVRGGEKRRTFELHVHPRLMTDIVMGLAEALRQHPIEDAQQRESLLAGFKAIEKALS